MRIIAKVKKENNQFFAVDSHGNKLGYLPKDSEFKDGQKIEGTIEPLSVPINDGSHGELLASVFVPLNS